MTASAFMPAIRIFADPLVGDRGPQLAVERELHDEVTDGLDLGDVEDIRDEADQPVGVLDRDLEHALAFFRQALLHGPAREAASATARAPR